MDISETDLNGKYRSLCCGSFSVDSSKIYISGEPIGFSLGRDNISHIVLPSERIAVLGSQATVIKGDPTYLRVFRKNDRITLKVEEIDHDNIIIFSKIG